METKFRTVKIMVVVLAVVCILSAASVPTSAAQPAGQKIITVWTHDTPGSVEGNALAATVKDFEQAQDDYTIELVPIASEIYADRVTGSAQSGSLPCVLEFDGPYLYSFAWPGYLQPIDRFVSPELKADFLPSIIAQGTFNEQLYSLGQFDSVLPYLSDSRRLQRAENVWLQAQVLIGETARHAQRYQAAQAAQQHRVLAEIERRLITTFDVAELMTLMSKISQLRGAGDHAEMSEAVSLSDYRLSQGEV